MHACLPACLPSCTHSFSAISFITLILCFVTPIPGAGSGPSQNPHLDDQSGRRIRQVRQISYLISFLSLHLLSLSYIISMTNLAAVYDRCITTALSPYSPFSHTFSPFSHTASHIPSFLEQLWLSTIRKSTKIPSVRALVGCLFRSTKKVMCVE